MPTPKKILSIILLSCMAVLSIRPLPAIFKKAWNNVCLAQAQHWDFDILQRNYHFIFQASHEAQNIIPPDEKITVSFNKNSIQWIAARYALYPHEIAAGAEYSLLPPGEQAIREGATLYPLAGGVQLSTTAPIQEKPYRHKNMATRPHAFYPILLLLLSLSLNGVLGYFLLQILKIHHKEAGKIWFWGTSCLVGNALHSMSVWILLLFPLPLNQGLLLGTWLSWIIVLLLLGASPQKRIKLNRLAPAQEEKGGTKRPVFPWAGFSVILIITAMVIVIALTPLSDWDGLSKWILKAKVLFLKQTFDFRYTHQNYYPLLWPITVATQFMLTGKVIDMAAQWMSAVYFILCTTQIWGGLTILNIPRQPRYYILLIFLPIFFSYRIMATANAENMFLATTAATVTALTACIKFPGTKSYGRLACFLLITLALIKFEGAVTVLMLLAGLAVTQKRAFFQKDNIPLWIGGGGACLLPALWITWIQSHGYMHSIVHVQTSTLTQNVLFLIRENGCRFLSSPVASLLMILYLLSILHPNTKAWCAVEKWNLWAWAGLFLFSLLGNAGQSFNEIQNTGKDAFIRLFLHTLPSLTLLISSRMFVRAQDSG